MLEDFSDPIQIGIFYQIIKFFCVQSDIYFYWLKQIENKQ